MRVHAIVELFRARAFVLGLAYGGIACCAVFVAAIITRRRTLDLAALAFAIGAWLAIRGAWGPGIASKGTAVGLAGVAVGGATAGWFARRIPRGRDHPALVAAVLIAPGAVLLAARAPLAGGPVARTTLVLATIGIGVGLRDFDASHGPRGAPWVLFAISSAGVYLAVPDTELARVLIGAALPFVLLSVPKPVARFGPAGSAALAGVFSWVVVVGGRGRPASVVGGLAVIGILLAEPLGRRLFGDLMSVQFNRERSTRWPPRFGEEYLLAVAFVAAGQILLALYASRLVANRDSVLQAVVVLLPAFIVALFCAPVLYAEPPPRHLTRASRATPQIAATRRRSS